MADLHSEIMNISADHEKSNGDYKSKREAYIFGHRDARHAAAELALSTNAGEAAPVAFEWPKLEKPARAGGGVFRAGVSSRFVVEAAQRLYEASEVDRNRTPEEMQEDERKRRSLWDMIHGSPHPPAAVQSQCLTCNGHGLVGGLLPGIGGYDPQDCPDCKGSGVEAAAVHGQSASTEGAEHATLMRFYGVESVDALVAAQAHHIEKLQSKLQPAPSFAPQRVREG